MTARVTFQHNDVTIDGVTVHMSPTCADMFKRIWNTTEKFAHAECLWTFVNGCKFGNFAKSLNQLI